MNLFGGAIQITGVALQWFIIFAVIFTGYLVGRITIKGVSLGTAGVFITALLFDAFFGAEAQVSMQQGGNNALNSFLIIENVGLILFVGAVGIMAGPGFFSNLKKNYKSYILLGVIITAIGVVSSVACYYVAMGSGSLGVPADAAAAGVSKKQYFISMITGIMSGSLTSTPAFSAAQSTAATIVSPDAAATIQNVVTIGHAISYMFGVIGVILFVQLVPRFLNADMKKERELISAEDIERLSDEDGKKRFEIDSYGFAAFGLVVVIGIFIGMIKIPLSSHGFAGTTFSLTTTGGVLIAGLVFAHFGHIGPLCMKVDENVLKVFRELGLALFLVGAGIPGGVSFAQYFQPIYFVYGIVITVVPMVLGYIIAKKVLKLSLLDSLGSITGGMTSTPALGALIRSAETEDVAASYASVYPVALICVVLSSQFMILIFGG